MKAIVSNEACKQNGDRDMDHRPGADAVLITAAD